MRRRPAIEIALDLQAMPKFAKLIRKRPLPPEMTPVIRVAAGSSQLTQEFASKYHCSEVHVREACIFFLQQAILFSGADDYRTLGVSPGASPEEIREHRRWLLMWLHPDRNKDKWESALFDRVVAAANMINGVRASAQAQTARKPHKRRHRRMRALKPVQRSAPPSRQDLQVKPIILVIVAAAAFLLSVATVVSVLGAENPTQPPPGIDPATGWAR